LPRGVQAHLLLLDRAKDAVKDVECGKDIKPLKVLDDEDERPSDCCGRLVIRGVGIQGKEYLLLKTQKRAVQNLAQLHGNWEAAISRLSTICGAIRAVCGYSRLVGALCRLRM